MTIIITNYPTAHSQIEHGVDGFICAQSIDGLVEHIEMMYYNKEARMSLSEKLRKKDFVVNKEIDKLYKLIS